MTFLTKILETKYEEIEQLDSYDELVARAKDYERSVRPIRWNTHLDVIAEIKRRSPSKGHLADIEHPDQQAQIYEAAGAAVVSVLTDREYFGARENDFALVQSNVTIPVLRKDFIVDVRQVYETYLMNADVMLLIVAAFDDDASMEEIYASARSLGLNVLVETHDEDELERALALSPEIVGVNIRNLASFDEDSGHGARVIDMVPDDVVCVWESGIKSRGDAQGARMSGADVVLVGQALVQSDDPGQLIRDITEIS